MMNSSCIKLSVGASIKADKIIEQFIDHCVCVNSLVAPVCQGYLIIKNIIRSRLLNFGIHLVDLPCWRL